MAAPLTSRVRLSPAAWIVVGATVVGAALRFASLASQSFWFDEAQLAHEAGLSLGSLLHTLGAQETSPPLYFLLAWLWAKVFGTSESGLRSLSAVLGTVTIPLAYLAGRELVSRRAGAVAAALVALSPFMIWYSQEAREYMLLGALSAASVFVFARAWNRGGARASAWWALLAALALLTHFFAAFLVAAEALLLLWRRRDRATVVAVVAAAAVGAALAPLAIADTGHPLGWLSSVPLATRAQQVPVAFALGTLYQSGAIDLGAGLLVAAALCALVIVLLAGGGAAAELRGAALTGALAGFVLLVPLGLALAGRDYFIARALLPAWVPLAVVLGAACTTARWPRAGAGLAVVALLAFAFAQARIQSDWRFQRQDWRGVARALGPAPATRAVVAFDGSLATDPLALYLPRVAWRQSADPTEVEEVDLVAGPEAQLGRLPPAVEVLGRAAVPGFTVIRLRLRGGWRGAPEQLGQRAGGLLSFPPAAPAVLIQPAVR